MATIFRNPSSRTTLNGGGTIELSIFFHTRPPFNVVLSIAHLGSKQPHWRLVSILKIVKRFESHADALPANCMVTGNPPIAIEMAAPITEFGTDLRRWDLAYQKRARQYGVFLACEPEFMELHNPPIVTDEMMYMVFNRIPGTQNPPAISSEEFKRLKFSCGIWTRCMDFH